MLTFLNATAEANAIYYFVGGLTTGTPQEPAPIPVYYNSSDSPATQGGAAIGARGLATFFGLYPNAPTAANIPTDGFTATWVGKQWAGTGRANGASALTWEYVGADGLRNTSEIVFPPCTKAGTIRYLTLADRVLPSTAFPNNGILASLQVPGSGLAVGVGDLVRIPPQGLSLRWPLTGNNNPILVGSNFTNVLNALRAQGNNAYPPWFVALYSGNADTAPTAAERVTVHSTKCNLAGKTTNGVGVAITPTGVWSAPAPGTTTITKWGLQLGTESTPRVWGKLPTPLPGISASVVPSATAVFLRTT